MQAKLATTVIVKTMDSQRWICRTHLFQPVEAFSITTFDPPGMASWVLRHRTAWHIRRSVAASRRTSRHRHQPYDQSAYPEVVDERFGSPRRRQAVLARCALPDI